MLFGLMKLGKEHALTADWLTWFITPDSEGGFNYRAPVIVVAAIGAVAALLWFRKVTPPIAESTELAESHGPAEPMKLLAEVPAEREHAAT